MDQQMQGSGQRHGNSSSMAMTPINAAERAVVMQSSDEKEAVHYGALHKVAKQTPTEKEASVRAVREGHSREVSDLQARRSAETTARCATEIWRQEVDEGGERAQRMAMEAAVREMEASRMAQRDQAVKDSTQHKHAKERQRSLELQSNPIRLHRLTERHDLHVDIDTYLAPPPDSSLPTPAPLQPYQPPHKHDSDQEEGVPNVRRGERGKRMLGGGGQVERWDDQPMTSRKLHQDTSERNVEQVMSPAAEEQIKTVRDAPLKSSGRRMIGATATGRHRRLQLEADIGIEMEPPTRSAQPRTLNTGEPVVPDKMDHTPLAPQQRQTHRTRLQTLPLPDRPAPPSVSSSANNPCLPPMPNFPPPRLDDADQHPLHETRPPTAVLERGCQQQKGQEGENAKALRGHKRPDLVETPPVSRLTQPVVTSPIAAKGTSICPPAASCWGWVVRSPVLPVPEDLAEANHSVVTSQGDGSQTQTHQQLRQEVGAAAGKKAKAKATSRVSCKGVSGSAKARPSGQHWPDTDSIFGSRWGNPFTGTTASHVGSRGQCGPPGMLEG
ncbi:unnamed protein product [Vitrella brassicaformis CCMP3155]|uniref:Uncharacterized protein n=1 Tax=Vitrella brassicaformis (strain CCMP3155) TaxID=1169540 RepID=A0A0G4H2G8_VITBC|nr:unnamed protein product [Vitrella brassicaformis CCMP3155]|eukprot:CEM37791.1 unnamed protein product [Vitrella brassicaformis CCMP3155]